MRSKKENKQIPKPVSFLSAQTWPVPSIPRANSPLARRMNRGRSSSLREAAAFCSQGKLQNRLTWEGGKGIGSFSGCERLLEGAPVSLSGELGGERQNKRF